MTELFPRDPPTLGQQIAELRVEEAMRARVYSRFVADGKMTQRKADMKMLAQARASGFFDAMKEAA